MNCSAAAQYAQLRSKSTETLSTKHTDNKSEIFNCVEIVRFVKENKKENNRPNFLTFVPSSFVASEFFFYKSLKNRLLVAGGLK